MALDKIPNNGASITPEEVLRDLLAITNDAAQRYQIPADQVTYQHVEPDDKVRLGCVYFHPETRQPSCIVGQWLNTRFGVTHDDLNTVDVNRDSHVSINDEGFDVAVNDMAADLPEETHQFLVDVQTAQDEGDPWLKAIYAAWDKVVGKREWAAGHDDEF